MAGTLGIDPTQDIAGVLGNECFVCGHTIYSKPGFFGPDGALTPKLPIHQKSCFLNTPLATLIAEYHRRIADLAGLGRAH